MPYSTPALSQKLTALLILFGIANLFALCLAIPLMSMMDMSDGLPCGMEHSAELCPMTLSDHLSFWQRVFIFSSPTWTLLALLAAFIVVIFSLKDTLNFEALHRLRFLQYNDSVSPPLVDYLKRQLSQGILHPKIY